MTTSRVASILWHESKYNIIKGDFSLAWWYPLQVHSQEFLKVGEFSANQGTNFWQVWKFNVSIKVRFFQLQFDDTPFFFYKQHFYKQRQVETGKKLSKS